MNGAVVLILIATMTVSGCTLGGDRAQRVIGTVKLGADLPLSGDDAPDGLPVRNAIELAIKQAGLTCGAAAHRDACVHLEAVIEDDVSQGIHDAAKGAQNVQRLAADARVIGMVGPLYESLAKSELPVANAAQLAMVSPAVTDECLTQEPADGHCGGLTVRLRPGGGNSFFRVVSTQLDEGARLPHPGQAAGLCPERPECLRPGRGSRVRRSVRTGRRNRRRPIGLRGL